VRTVPYANLSDVGAYGTAGYRIWSIGDDGLGIEILLEGSGSQTVCRPRA